MFKQLLCANVGVYFIKYIVGWWEKPKAKNIYFFSSNNKGERDFFLLVDFGCGSKLESTKLEC